jgi:cytochrome c-type biogenesis protein
VPGTVIAFSVESFSITSIGLAFLAGLVSFLSPCVLPLVPAYLSFVSGVGVERLTRERGRVAAVALAFIAGFSLVFMALGAGAGGIGRLLLDYHHELTIAAGLFLALSGLVIAGVVRLPEASFAVSGRRGPVWAFFTGIAVAIGWTPCVGYVLAGILTMAASSQNARAGAFLLFVYALGLGVPFLASALAFEWVSERLAAVKRHYRAVQIVSGVLLVVIGVLIASGVYGRLNGLLFRFDSIGL